MKTVKGHSVRGLCGLKPLQPEDNVYKILKCRISLRQGSYQAAVGAYSPRRVGLEEVHKAQDPPHVLRSGV